MEKKKRKSINSKNDEATTSKLQKIDDCDSAKCYYDQLPTEILLKIFQYLPLEHLCKAASVCRNWRRIAHDETLWYQIDLSQLDVDLKRLWKLVRQPYASRARSFEIHTSTRKQNRGQMDRMVTPAFLQKLNDTCKSLTIIKLKYVDLSAITVNDLKSNLAELHLMRCEIPLEWFSGNKFKCLQVLDLTDSAGVRSKHISDLVQNCSKTLHTLRLSSCYRVDDKAIEIVTNEFKSLTCLRINGTNASDLALHWICTRLKRLQVLDIRDCKMLKTPDIEFISESYSEINSFKLYH